MATRLWGAYLPSCLVNGRGRCRPATACIWSMPASTLRRAPQLADVRDAVRREWANARRPELNEVFYQSPLKCYTVAIEQPSPLAGEKNVVEVRR